MSMYILILGESTRGLLTKHGLLSSQLIRQPTAPTYVRPHAHTTTVRDFFFFFARKKTTPPCIVTKTKPQTPRFRRRVWRDPNPGAPIMRSPPPVGVEGPSVLGGERGHSLALHRAVPSRLRARRLRGGAGQLCGVSAVFGVRDARNWPSRRRPSQQIIARCPRDAGSTGPSSSPVCACAGRAGRH